MTRTIAEKITYKTATAGLIARGDEWRRKAPRRKDQSAKSHQVLFIAALLIASAVSTSTTAQTWSLPRPHFSDAETGWGCRFTGECGVNAGSANCADTKNKRQGPGCTSSSSAESASPHSLRSDLSRQVSDDSASH